MTDDTPKLEEKTEELLKKADAVVNSTTETTTATTTEPPKVYPVMPQGHLAAMIVRTKEQGEKVPPQFKPAVLKPDGDPLPHWQQVANIMNRPHKKVCIVGFADTKDQAPFDDPTWEIWGLNDLHAQLKRYDRWFDIHDRDNIQQDYKLMRNRGETPPENIGLKGLSKLNVPVYMQDHYDDIPNSIKFPLDEITKSFPYGDYMTNSISYMIGLAILEGFEEIRVVGVDMAVGCLDGSTRVLTADLKWIKSEDLKVGDELIGFDEESTDGNGKTRRWRKTKVTAVS